MTKRNALLALSFAAFATGAGAGAKAEDDAEVVQPSTCYLSVLEGVGQLACVDENSQVSAFQPVTVQLEQAGSNQSEEPQYSQMRLKLEGVSTIENVYGPWILQVVDEHQGQSTEVQLTIDPPTGAVAESRSESYQDLLAPVAYRRGGGGAYHRGGGAVYRRGGVAYRGGGAVYRRGGVVVGSPGYYGGGGAYCGYGGYPPCGGGYYGGGAVGVYRGGAAVYRRGGAVYRGGGVTHYGRGGRAYHGGGRRR